MNKFEYERAIRNELKKIIAENFIDDWFEKGLPGFNFSTPRQLLESSKGEELLKSVFHLTEQSNGL